MSATLKPLIAKVAAGASLSRGEAEQAFGILMSGEATPSQIGGFLMALRVRGESVEELTGAVAVMRANMVPVSAPADAIDIVGTGGDHAGTVNVSTCSAFVAAGCGLTVAKHGNRALSSKSGSADVLTALGVKVDLSPAQISHSIAETGLGFMFAPAHHSAMRFVGPTRVELGTRTIFNLLGPLSNPASVDRMLVGVYAPEWLVPVAETLLALGARSAWIVHGDGLDEMTICGRTDVAAIRNGRVESFSIEPEDVGLSRAPLAEILGDEGAANARALRAVLEGARNAYRDIVLLNVAGALVMADRAPDLRAGIAEAAAAIDDGRALAALERLVIASNRTEGAAA